MSICIYFVYRNTGHHQRLQAGTSQLSSSHPYGLMVECDGVLVDIHKDAHRVAFNQAFEVATPNMSLDIMRSGRLSFKALRQSPERKRAGIGLRLCSVES